MSSSQLKINSDFRQKVYEVPGSNQIVIQCSFCEQQLEILKEEIAKKGSLTQTHCQKKKNFLTLCPCKKLLFVTSNQLQNLSDSCNHLGNNNNKEINLLQDSKKLQKNTNVFYYCKYQQSSFNAVKCINSTQNCNNYFLFQYNSTNQKIDFSQQCQNCKTMIYFHFILEKCLIIFSQDKIYEETVKNIQNQFTEQQELQKKSLEQKNLPKQQQIIKNYEDSQFDDKNFPINNNDSEGKQTIKPGVCLCQQQQKKKFIVQYYSKDSFEKSQQVYIKCFNCDYELQIKLEENQQSYYVTCDYCQHQSNIIFLDCTCSNAEKIILNKNCQQGSDKLCQQKTIKSMKNDKDEQVYTQSPILCTVDQSLFVCPIDGCHTQLPVMSFQQFNSSGNNTPQKVLCTKCYKAYKYTYRDCRIIEAQVLPNEKIPFIPEKDNNNQIQDNQHQANIEEQKKLEPDPIKKTLPKYQQIQPNEKKTNCIFCNEHKLDITKFNNIAINKSFLLECKSNKSHINYFFKTKCGILFQSDTSFDDFADFPQLLSQSCLSGCCLLLLQCKCKKIINSISIASETLPIYKYTLETQCDFCQQNKIYYFQCQCSSSKKSIIYKFNKDFAWGEQIKCPNPECTYKQYALVQCPQPDCQAINVYKNNYQMGERIECKQCGEQFFQVSCPHCLKCFYLNQEYSPEEFVECDCEINSFQLIYCQKCGMKRCFIKNQLLDPFQNNICGNEECKAEILIQFCSNENCPKQFYQDKLQLDKAFDCNLCGRRQMLIQCLGCKKRELHSISQDKSTPENLCQNCLTLYAKKKAENQEQKSCEIY